MFDLQVSIPSENENTGYIDSVQVYAAVACTDESIWLVDSDLCIDMKNRTTDVRASDTRACVCVCACMYARSIE